MPNETIVVVGAIVLMFAVFAAALAWGDYCTRKTRQPDA